jgi:hypothetical protein
MLLMPKKFLFISVLTLAVTLLFTISAFSQITTADIKGKVVDEKSEALPGARVFVKNVETGRERGVYTDAKGEYRLVALPPGTYDFNVEMEGFATQVTKGVVLNVGMIATMDFAMKLASVAETITVTGEAPLVETTESDISALVNEQQITSLPLNGRTFSELALLAPGAQRAESWDPTKTRMGNVSIAGGASRGVNMTVDGGDNNDDAVGGQVQTFSAEGIQEFEVITQRYKAEFGRATEGIVNVVTKSGTNEIHGTVFGFFRDDSLNKNEYFAEQAGIEKPKFARQQYGFSLGAPIVKDKTHFFAAFERMQEDNYVTVYTHGVFTEYEGAIPQPFRDNNLTARIDHTLNEKQFLMVRLAYQRNSLLNDYVGGTVTSDASATTKNFARSLLAAHTFAISDRALNEFHFQYMWFHNTQYPDITTPGIGFAHATIGSQLNVPQETKQRKWIFRDDFSLHKGSHDFKWGGEYQYEPMIGGLFGYYANGYFQFIGDTINPAELDFYIKAGGKPEFGTMPHHKLNLYWQDDWKVNDQLTFNLGLRYELEKNIYFDQTGHAGADWLLVNRPDLYPNQPKDDYNNIMPRIGFAYDVKGNGKSVLRGGYGRYYDEVFLNVTLFADVLTHNKPPWGYTVYFLSGMDWASLGVDASNLLDYVMSHYEYDPGNPLALAQRLIHPDSATPYSDQFSIGFSHQISESIAFDADVIYIRSETERYGNRVNRLNMDTGHRTISDEIGEIRWYNTDGWGRYKGLNLSLRKRFANRSQFIFNYTLSKAEGYTSLGFSGTPVYENDPLSPNEYGPRQYDSRHRFMISGILQLPADFQLSGLAQYFSARPYEITTGNDDNRDGYRWDRPADLPVRNSGRGGDFLVLDMRVTKFIRFSGKTMELMFEVFNLGNRANYRTYDGNQRNTTTFGTPSQTRGTPMQAQLGIRFRF